MGRVDSKIKGWRIEEVYASMLLPSFKEVYANVFDSNASKRLFNTFARVDTWGAGTITGRERWYSWG